MLTQSRKAAEALRKAKTEKLFWGKNLEPKTQWFPGYLYQMVTMWNPKTGWIQGLEVLKRQPRGDERMLRQVADYSVPNVTEKVLRIIISYMDYINRNVWKKTVIGLFIVAYQVVKKIKPRV